MTEAATSPRPTRLAIGHVAMAGAFATLLFFFLGWAWAAFVSSHSAALVGLFTTQPAGSAAALWIGGLCARPLCYHLTRTGARALIARPAGGKLRRIEFRS